MRTVQRLQENGGWTLELVWWSAEQPTSLLWLMSLQRGIFLIFKKTHAGQRLAGGVLTFSFPNRSQVSSPLWWIVMQVGAGKLMRQDEGEPPGRLFIFCSPFEKDMCDGLLLVTSLVLLMGICTLPGMYASKQARSGCSGRLKVQKCRGD